METKFFCRHDGFLQMRIEKRFTSGKANVLKARAPHLLKSLQQRTPRQMLLFGLGLKTYATGQVACRRNLYSHLSGNVCKWHRHKVAAGTTTRCIKSAYDATVVPGPTPARPRKVVPGVRHGADRHAADRDKVIPFVMIKQKIEIGTEPERIRRIRNDLDQTPITPRTPPVNPDSV
jgi:hypothetical protein